MCIRVSEHKRAGACVLVRVCEIEGVRGMRFNKSSPLEGQRSNFGIANALRNVNLLIQLYKCSTVSTAASLER